jgi:hypothetical protein
MKECAVGVFIDTDIGMALGRIPGFKVDRTGIGLLGAVLWLGCGG